MQINNLHSKIWENIWQSVINDPPKRHEKNTQRHLELWDKKAKGFSERTSEADAAQRKQKIIKWLQDEGALTKDAKVLDIGAGPGNWAIFDITDAIRKQVTEAIKSQSTDGIFRNDKRFSRHYAMASQAMIYFDNEKNITQSHAIFFLDR
jgi:hypothetical protein